MYDSDFDEQLRIVTINFDINDTDDLSETYINNDLILYCLTLQCSPCLLLYVIKLKQIGKGCAELLVIWMLGMVDSERMLEQ